MAEGDRVVARLTLTGMHTSIAMSIPPTGKPVIMEGMPLYRLRDGKLVAQWTRRETLGVLQQLGAVTLAAHSGQAPTHEGQGILLSLTRPSQTSDGWTASRTLPLPGTPAAARETARRGLGAMTPQLFDTYTRSVRDFVPLRPPQVGRPVV